MIAGIMAGRKQTALLSVKVEFSELSANCENEVFRWSRVLVVGSGNGQILLKTVKNALFFPYNSHCAYYTKAQKMA